MSRSIDSKETVKRQLEDYHLRRINTPEIYFALTRAQQALATKYDLIRKQITINTIADETDYDLVVTDNTNVSAGSFVTGTLYQITTVGTTDFTAIGAASNNAGVVFIATGAGTGTGVAKAAYRKVKRIKSWKTPNTWLDLKYKTEQEFDELLMEQPQASQPQWLTVRNGLLIFHGAPTIDDESVILQVYLHSPIQEMSDSVEPEVDDPMDAALEQYAIWFLLPLDHPNRLQHYDMYSSIANERYGTLHSKVGKPLVPKANW